MVWLVDHGQDVVKVGRGGLSRYVVWVVRVGGQVTLSGYVVRVDGQGTWSGWVVRVCGLAG